MVAVIYIYNMEKYTFFIMILKNTSEWFISDFYFNNLWQ